MKKMLLAGVAALLISGPALAFNGGGGFNIDGTIGGFKGNGTAATTNGGAAVGGHSNGWGQSSGASVATTGEVTASNTTFRASERTRSASSAQQQSAGVGLGSFGFPGVNGLGVVSGSQQSELSASNRISLNETTRSSNVQQGFGASGSQFSNGSNASSTFSGGSQGFGFAMRGAGITGNVTGGVR